MTSLPGRDTANPDTTPDTTAPSLAHEIVAFWRDAGPAKWFSKNAAFDATFMDQFREAHYSAARQELEHWMHDPESALALILLLDQYPRNAFRGTSHMFATDGLALRYARQALAADFLPRVEPALRNFLCLPFMHAENLSVQEEALILYTAHVPDSVSWAVTHHAIIQRFGRFPHRNAALDRDTTVEECRFLDEGGFAG